MIHKKVEKRIEECRWSNCINNILTMSIKINKGGDLGKYFYSKDDVIYGPIKLDELLQRVDENTLVF